MDLYQAALKALQAELTLLRCLAEAVLMFKHWKVMRNR